MQFICSKTIFKINLSWLLIFPIWIAVVSFARMVNKAEYFNIQHAEEFLFLFSVILSWLIAMQLELAVRKKGVNFVDGERSSKAYLIAGISALAFIGIFFTETLINNFLKIVSDQNELGLYGLRNSDFSFHLGISKFLLTNPVLDLNPFYGNEPFYYYSYFDLLVTSFSRILGVSVNNIFLLVMPIISFICLIALFNVSTSKSPFYLKVALAFPSYLIFQEFVAYSYNALALIYGAFLIFLYVLGIKYYSNLAIKDLNLKFTISWGLTLSIASIFVSQLKFLIWLPIYLGITFVIALGCINNKYKVKNLAQGFAIISLISSPLIWLKSYYSNSPHPYVFRLNQPFPLIFTTEILLILLLTIIIFITLLMRKGYFIRFYELIFILCGVVFGAIVIMFSFRPLINDGGAIYAYPSSVMRVAFYFLFILFSYELGLNFPHKFKIIKSIIFIYFLISMPILIWGGGRLEWVLPNPGWGTVPYATSPNKEILDLINTINERAEKGDLVLTNYADLDRYYSFSTFSEFLPFLSSGLYAGISSQKDFELRRRIYDSLFKEKDINLFSKLINYYPTTKFLLIDNSIAFQSTPPAELYLAYGGSKASSIYSIIDKNKVIDPEWRYFPSENYYERDFGNGFILKVFDFEKPLKTALELGVFKLIKSNKSGSLYLIEGPP